MSNATIRNLRSREQTVFSTIPGMKELMRSPAADLSDMGARYPDAAFALRTANELFHHDRELSLITQRAYFAILGGEPIPSVRYRYDREMEHYVREHMWDD